MVGKWKWISALLIFVTGCASPVNSVNVVDTSAQGNAIGNSQDSNIVAVLGKSDTVQKIYFAGGCFWGVEEYFSRIEGVIDSVSG